MDLGPLLPWFNLVHVLSAMAFILIHGFSGLIALRVRAERDRSRLTGLLDLSAGWLNWGWLALATVLASGILAGIAGGWWTSGRLWIWASLIVFIAVGAAMTPIAAGYMEAARHAVGMPSVMDRRKNVEPPPAASDAELERILSSSRPLVTTVIGLGGIAVLTWLMMMKPF